MKRTSRSTSRSRASRAIARGESGSAYLIVLLVLVVLTIIGLSLVAVTQTEMQIGSSERVANRTFYSADAGVGIATARVLVDHDHSPLTVVLRDSDVVPSINLGESVEISPFLPILDAPCNLCTINQGNEYYEINHALTVRAIRRGWQGAEPDANSQQLAQKTLGVMVEFQPWQLTTESFEALDDSNIGDIKY